MSYGSVFARYYDLLQKDVGYRDIAALVDGLVKEFSSFDEVGVDLACGTGTLSRELCSLGYEMIGVDLSEEMLTEARRIAAENDQDITFVRQDMRELELWGAADFIVCCLDSLNHLSGLDDLRKTVERASMFVCDGGLFIFDVNTEYKHKNVLKDNTFCFEEEGLLCLWRNSPGPGSSVQICLDLFEERPDGSYERSQEVFTEVVYSPADLEQCLRDNDFEIIMTCDGFTRDPLTETSQRALYVCRRMER